MRGPGTIGRLLTAYDIWRRLPASQRRQLTGAARRHGPRIAMAAAAAAKAKRAAKKASLAIRSCSSRCAVG